MPEFSNIMLSCFKKTNDFRLKTTSPHRLAQTKDQIIAHLLSVHVLARVEEFMSNGQIVHARCGKRHVTLAFSPKIRHIHRRVCCSFEFAKVGLRQEFEETKSRNTSEVSMQLFHRSESYLFYSISTAFPKFFEEANFQKNTKRMITVHSRIFSCPC